MPLKTIFATNLSDHFPNPGAVSLELAREVETFFRISPLFRWQDANNDCEDRANAISLLLQQWEIPSLKAWVFSGSYLHRDNGLLHNCWKYHVAAALAVRNETGLEYLVIDPATLSSLDTIETWANNITQSEYSYHLVKEREFYIFHPSFYQCGIWYSQNSQNYKWTIQGLAGINGVSKRGQAQLVFNKSTIKKTEAAFQQLVHNNPFLHFTETGERK